jgi:hypothetical protein
LTTAPPQFTIKQGPSYGAVHVVHEVARSLGYRSSTRRHS